MKVFTRSLTQGDYPSIKEIYEQGIATGNATFETAAPSWEVWDKNHLTKARIVAVNENDEVIGWAALTAISGRCVYAGVAELSVYIHTNARGKGVGKMLLNELVSSCVS